MTKKLIFIFTIVLISLNSIVNAQVTRKVLVEEFTGIWCPNCPDGRTILDGIITANPDRVVPIGMHNGDIYTIPYETTLEANLGVAAFPRAGIDRFTYSGGNAFVMSRGYWAGAVAARLNVASPVEILIYTDYNPTSRLVTVKVDYTFMAAVSEETRLTCVLMEDNLVATQSGATGAYTHMDVCRALLSGDVWGDANNPASVTSGQSFTKTYTYTLPATMNENNIHVAAFINKKVGTSPVMSTGTEVLNAQDVRVFNAPTAITKVENKNAVTCAPNPFTDMTSINFNVPNTANVNAFVTDIRGVKVAQLINETRSAGNHSIFWAGQNNSNAQMPSGVYFINVIFENKKISVPVMYNN
jgi:hypothetical protein